MLIKKLTLCTLLALAVTSTSTSTFGDDTELYVKESTTRTGARPKAVSSTQIISKKTELS